MSNCHIDSTDPVVTSKTTRQANTSEDVLREVNQNLPSDVFSVLEKLERHGADSTTLYQSLLRASKGIQNRKHFYVPRDNPDSPLVLMIAKDEEEIGPFKRVTFFTSDKCLKELYELFIATDVLNFNQGIMFGGVNAVLADTVRQICDERGGIYSFHTQQTLMTLSPQLAMQLNVKVPDHVYLTPLSRKDSSTVHSNWRYRFYKKHEATEREIVNLPSMGLYLRETDELVSWILMHDLGSIGMMYTKKAHRRCGYGELVAKALAQKMATSGQTPFVMVSENSAALSCFLKIGFQQQHVLNWLIYSPPQLAELVEHYVETALTPEDELKKMTNQN